MASPISFTGLASGVDTDAIISKLLELRRQPVKRLTNRLQLLDIKRNAFRDVNTQTLALQNEALNLRLDSTFISRSVTSSDTSSVRVTAALGAAKTNHRVKVLQLAQEASVNSNRWLSRARTIGSNTVGITQLGTVNNLNAPGAGRILGGVTLIEATTLSELGLDSDFTLQIDPDAAGIRNPIQITGLDGDTTVGQMMQAIRNQAGATVKVQLVHDQALGGKVIQIAGDYVGVNIGISGAVAENAFGIQNGQSAFSNGTTGLGSARAVAALAPQDVLSGTALVVSTNGRAGSLTGTVDLAAAAGGGNVLGLTLNELGITDFTAFEIDPDASGATGNVTVRKEDGSLLNGSDSIADLIDAINQSVPDVTAQVVDGPGGAKYFQIIANRGGRDLTVNQFGASNGILKNIFDLDVETVTTSNATTDSDDFTMISTFYRRGDVSPTSRTVVSGVKNDYRVYGVANLIDGVTLMGSSAGSVFSPGSARIQINSGDSLSIEASERTQFYGATGVTSSSFATGLGLDPDGAGNAAINRSIAELNAAGAFGLDSAITAGSFKVGDATLTLTQDEIDNGLTLGELIARINSSGQGMFLRYEAGTDRFIATAAEYGPGGSVSFGGYNGLPGQSNVLKVLGLTGATNATSVSGGVAAGRIDAGIELEKAGFSIRPTSGTVTINGVSIAVDAQVDSLDDLIEKINSSAAGVTASLDPDSNRLTLIQKVTEDTNADYIQLGSSSDTSNLFTALRLIQGSNADGSVSSVESARVKNNVGSERQQARIEVNNIVYTRNSNTINDIVPGLTFELLGVSSNNSTITVSGDKEKAIDAIARFVVEYNKLIKQLNPARISTADRKYLEAITDDERSNLTYNELVERLEKYETLNKNEAIRKESSFSLMQNQLRNSLFSMVEIPGSSLRSLADIGINTGQIGAPLASDYSGVLVLDSTDFEEIKAALMNNTQLNQALEDDDVSVAKLFNQNASSMVSVKATSRFDESTPLANDITFEVYDGTTRTTVTIPAGSHSRNTVLSIISNELQRKGLSDIKVSFDGTGHLQFNTEKDNGRAYIRILDLTPAGETDRLAGRFGLNGGSFIGPEAADKSGLAQKLYATLRTSTGIEGFLPQRISVGGNYGQGSIFDEQVNIQEQITRLEDRLTAQESRMRAQFAAMEKVISRMQEQQNALSQYLSSVASSRSS